MFCVSTSTVKRENEIYDDGTYGFRPAILTRPKFSLFVALLSKSHFSIYYYSLQTCLSLLLLIILLFQRVAVVRNCLNAIRSHSLPIEAL